MRKIFKSTKFPAGTIIFFISRCISEENQGKYLQGIGVIDKLSDYLGDGDMSIKVISEDNGKEIKIGKKYDDGTYKWWLHKGDRYRKLEGEEKLLWVL